MTNSESYYPYLITGLRRGTTLLLTGGLTYRNGDRPTDAQAAALEAQGLKLEPSTIEGERLALCDEARADSGRAALLERAQREDDAQRERTRAGVNRWR